MARPCEAVRGPKSTLNGTTGSLGLESGYPIRTAASIGARLRRSRSFRATALIALNLSPTDLEKRR